jgi:hypothetical protein
LDPEPEIEAEPPKNEEKPEAESDEIGRVSSFFSFNESVEDQVQGREKPKEPEKKGLRKLLGDYEDEDKAPEKPPPPKEDETWVFLPELSLPGLLQEKATSYRSMQTEAKEMEANTKKELREAKKRKIATTKAAEQMKRHVVTAKKAWKMAVDADTKSLVQKGMDLATLTMREVGKTLTELSNASSELDAIHSLAIDFEKRAAEGLQAAPQFWKGTASLTKTARGRLDFQRDLAVSIVSGASPAKQAALQKADDTVKLVNDKLRRWADEERILQSEAADGEKLRQRKLQAEMEIQRQQQAQVRAQLEMEQTQQRRLQELWGYTGR